MEGNQSWCYHCFYRLEEEAPCPRCGFDSAREQDTPLALPMGSLLAGKYVVGRVLGQGGFGITYKAFDPVLELVVAIKEYMPQFLVNRSPQTKAVRLYSSTTAQAYAGGMADFLEEARTLAKLSQSREVVPVRSFFEENGTAYFVMDYVDGISFQAYLQNHGGSIDPQRALEILLPVMDGLSYAHGHGVIHRDVTPDNIYITRQQEVRLLDFGSARYSMGDKSKSLDVILKPGFAPKEQYMRRGRQGPSTDVYSVAACFYVAVTGVLPPDSLERMEEDTLLPPSALGISLPAGLERALLKGLAVAQENRFASMEELKAAMLSGDAAGSTTPQRFPKEEILPPPASPPSVTQALTGAPPTEEKEERGAVEGGEKEKAASSPRKLGKLGILCLSGAAVVLLAVVGWRFWLPGMGNPGNGVPGKLASMEETSSAVTSGAASSQAASSAVSPPGDTSPYLVEELGLTFYLPEGVTAFTPDTPAEDPNWEAAGLGSKEEQEIIYTMLRPLAHFSGSQGDTNIYVSLAPDTPMLAEVESFRNLSPQTLTDLARQVEETATDTGESQGASFIKDCQVRVVKGGTLPFLRCSFVFDGLDMGGMGQIQFLTVENGKTVFLTQLTLEGDSRTKDTTLLEGLAKTVSPSPLQ